MYDVKSGSIEVVKIEETFEAEGSALHFELHGPGEGKLHKKRAIKRVGSPNAYEVEWLVGSLNGVHCYITEVGGKTVVVMTTQDLKP